MKKLTLALTTLLALPLIGQAVDPAWTHIPKNYKPSDMVEVTKPYQIEKTEYETKKAYLAKFVSISKKHFWVSVPQRDVAKAASYNAEKQLMTVLSLSGPMNLVFTTKRGVIVGRDGRKIRNIAMCMVGVKPPFGEGTITIELGPDQAKKIKHDLAIILECVPESKLESGYGSINPFLETEETHREPTISEPVKTTILSMNLRAHLVRATIYQKSTGKILKVLTL